MTTVNILKPWIWGFLAGSFITYSITMKYMRKELAKHVSEIIKNQK